MMHKRWGLKISALTLAQTILLLLALALPVIQWNVSVSQQWPDDLRQLKIEKLQLARALNILKDHRHVTETLNAKPDTVNSITLSLIEAIKNQTKAAQLALTQLTVTQSADEPAMGVEKTPNTQASSLHALTVNFAVHMDRAVNLLLLFDAIREAAVWRPIEIRGCTVVRLSESLVSLQATCSVDVYYFPVLHK